MKRLTAFAPVLACAFAAALSLGGPRPPWRRIRGR